MVAASLSLTALLSTTQPVTHAHEGTTTEKGPKDITMTTTTRPAKPDDVTYKDLTKDTPE